ncbi:hypothetical protein TRVL_06712 [Trypanosoma vivax]|nr:hypothetical protein TRVL_06712 [Trypanosoma vivax]
MHPNRKGRLARRMLCHHHSLIILFRKMSSTKCDDGGTFFSFFIFLFTAKVPVATKSGLLFFSMMQLDARHSDHRGVNCGAPPVTDKGLSNEHSMKMRGDKQHTETTSLRW